MGLGNNRDYKTRDRNIRRSIAVTNARKLVLMGLGMDESTALRQAMAELKAGELKAQVKAWKDPIQEHHRTIIARRKSMATLKNAVMTAIEDAVFAGVTPKEVNSVMSDLGYVVYNEGMGTR